MKKFILPFLGTVLIHLGASAQISEQQATNLVLTSVVYNRVDSVNVFVNQTLQSSEYFSISPYDSIAAPYNNYWLYFIDDMPQFGWEHNCRYVFVNQDDGSYNVVQSQRPPVLLNKDFDCVQRKCDPIFPAPVSQNGMDEFNPKSKKEHILLTERLLSNLPQNVKSKDNDEIVPVSNLEAFESEVSGIVLLCDAPENSSLNEHRQLSWNVNMDNWVGPAGWSGENVKRVGIRFDTLDLKDVKGWKIKQIKFIPFASENQQSVAVWYRKEEKMELVYEQFPSECVYGEWNTVNLDEDVSIEDGVEVVIVQSSYGAAEEDFALEYIKPPHDKNMYTGGTNGAGWQFSNMNAFGYSLAANIENSECGMRLLGNKEGQLLSGYNVYRDGEKIASIPYTFQTYFIDKDGNATNDCNYCVSALYGEEESEMVCTSITGINEGTFVNSVAIHPNPTTGLAEVDRECVSVIQVYNFFGQQMTTVYNTNKIDLSTFNAGVYMLKIQMKDGTTGTVRVLRL